jgi:hypothetical protein
MSQLPAGACELESVGAGTGLGFVRLEEGWFLGSTGEDCRYI